MPRCKRWGRRFNRWLLERETRQSAWETSAAVRCTAAGLDSIERLVAKAIVAVEEPGVLGGNIGTVVETIDDLAARKERVALSAALETARTGEHGRGFVVVTDEVRRWAKRGQEGTRSTASRIGALQAGRRKAVVAMEQGGAAMASGRQQAEAATSAAAPGHSVATAEVSASMEGMAVKMEQISGQAEEMAVTGQER